MFLAFQWAITSGRLRQRLIANLKLDKARTFQLSGFIDNYLQLNPVEKQQFQVEVDRIKLPTERENVMELTTSWKEEGIVQGRESATRIIVSKQLTRKLGNLSPELRRHSLSV
jgi:hypothetical protein